MGTVSKHCSACGIKLEVKREYYGFDEDTGKPLFGGELVCPNSAAAKGWWKFWLRLKDHTGDGWGEW